MASEVVIANAFVYQRLAGDATLTGLLGGASVPRIYQGKAPQGAMFPAVVYQHQGGSDVRGATEATRIGANLLYVVRGVAQAERFTGDLQTIEERIDARLHRTSGAVVLNSVTLGEVIACVRLQPFDLTEDEEGVEWRHLGGIYRLFVQRSS